MEGRINFAEDGHLLEMLYGTSHSICFFDWELWQVTCSRGRFCNFRKRSV